MPNKTEETGHRASDRFLFFTAIQACLRPFGVVMLLASQAVFYNVIFGLLEGWLTFNWKGGSVSIGKVAHFHFGKVAHFREEIPYNSCGFK